jgi:integrase
MAFTPEDQNFIKDRELVAADPSEVSKRSRYEARDRVLSDEEIKLFWPACDRLGWPFGPIFKLLALTAQREGEVGGARWGEIDMAARVWTIPGARAKNGKAHAVHLSQISVEILEGLPRTGELLFASRGPNPPSDYSAAKRRLDGHMGAAPPWVLHDLRRTAVTGMARLGIAPHVVDRVLNHTAGTIRGVAATYNRFQYEEDRAAALDGWARHIETLVRPGGSGNVVEMRQHVSA